MKTLALASLLGVASAQQAVWAQCGGKNFAGATTCVSGAGCVAVNEWYSQCQPGASEFNYPAVYLSTLITQKAQEPVLAREVALAPVAAALAVVVATAQAPLRANSSSLVSTSLDQ